MYPLQILEEAKTYDHFWNAIELEIIYTGLPHTSNRYYWAKKVMEWTPDMETAFHYLVYLNDKFTLDGRHPGTYAGILSCFGKWQLEKPPSQETEIFGTVENMELDPSLVPGIRKYVEKWYKVDQRPIPEDW